MGRWTAYLNGKETYVTSDQIAEFRRFFVGESELSTRMSDLIWLDMYVYAREYGIGPHTILRSIRNIDAGEPHDGTKLATPFKRSPLKGLWHKHFFDARFMAHNIVQAHGRGALERLVTEIMDPAKHSVVTMDMVNELAYRATHESLEKRSRDGKITGEWIIFAKNDGKKYYLCLNTHKCPDRLIHERIMGFCTVDFPDLALWFG